MFVNINGNDLNVEVLGPDNAPVLICSDLPEADHMRMPVGPAIGESGILPPLSYYKLTVPVAPLPRRRCWRPRPRSGRSG